MIVICCVDDRFGLAFNHRRVSSDAVVTEDILKRIGDGRLYVSPYSAKLFFNFPEDHITVTENPFEVAGEDDYVLAELEDPMQAADKIEKLIVYFWNRRYPSNVKLTFDESVWNRTLLTEMPGKSHENISVELWERKA